MLNREQLETFATVIDVGSFERAASALNVTRGAISQRIKALEESVAAVLLLREKPVTPTQAGEILLRHVKALRLLEDSALSALMPDPRGRQWVQLAIAVNADSLATWFPSVLWPLLKAHRISLEVVTDDQDHTVSRLARGEVIGCVSTECKPAVGFAAEPLGAMEYRCMATCTFAQKHFPNGMSVQSVLQAPAVLFNRKDSLHDEFLEKVFGFRVERYARHYLPAPGTLLEAVGAGVGYGMVPSLQTRNLGDGASLVDLAPEHAVMVELYWHHWEVDLPLSREITQRVVSEAARCLDRPPASPAVQNAEQAPEIALGHSTVLDAARPARSETSSLLAGR